MKTVLCTTGTSIARGLTAENVTRHSIRERLDKLATDRTPEELLVQASAESHSLLRLNIGAADQVHLLHSSTEIGLVCAKMLKELIRDQLRSTVHLHEVAGLQVNDSNRFRREGVNSLFEILDRLAHPQLGGPDDLWLNITGGFKSVVPYVTIYGQLYRIPVAYMFEQSNELICLPAAPISFDFERLGQANDAIHSLSQEGVMRKDTFFNAIPNLHFSQRDWFMSLIEEDADGMVTLSAFGVLLHRANRQEQSSVMLSPSASLAYSKARSIVRSQFTFMLTRVQEPLWRRQKAHAFSGTDLTVFKPGNTGERMACIIQGPTVYVCELLTHDSYERELPGKMKSNYNLSNFVPWTLPDTEPAPPATDEDAYRMLEIERDETKTLLDETENLLTAARTTISEMSVAAEQREREQTAQIANLSSDLVSTKNTPSWWRRLFGRTSNST